MLTLVNDLFPGVTDSQKYLPYFSQTLLCMCLSPLPFPINQSLPSSFNPFPQDLQVIDWWLNGECY